MDVRLGGIGLGGLGSIELACCAAIDGVTVATGGFLPDDEAAVENRRMRVEPDYQGNGYGAAILSSLEEAALRDSYERVVLWTHELLAAARAVYESLGYNETGREAGRDGHDRIRYAKRL